MSAPIPEGQLSSIKDALFAGQKIEAIKLYRETTSTGLAEAKDAVDKLEQELRTASPEKFTTAPAGRGCSALIVAVCAFLLVVIVLVITNR